MRYTPLLAFGLGQFALAQNTTFSSTSSSTGGPKDAPRVGGFPEQLGDFRFFGCLGSSQAFPTFALLASSDDMSLDICAASCPGRFMGVFDTDCYCGEEVDNDSTQRVANSDCDTSCRGNELEACGGMSGAVARRHNVPLSVLLTVYIRTRDVEMASGPTATPTETVTQTITDVHTITSCPSEVPDCPIGHITTTTYTTEYCPQPTSDWHKKVLICYGDYCAPENACLECTKYRVVCEGDVCHPEECDNEEYYKKVVCAGDECLYPACEGDDCRKKVVCYGDQCLAAECYGDECEKNYVCHGDQCGHKACFDDECYKHFECHGDECNVVTPCEGVHCPVPAPPAPVKCHGDECGHPKDTNHNGEVCVDPHCPAPPVTTPIHNGEFCVGPHCPAPPVTTPIHNNEECYDEYCNIPVAGSGKILPALGMGAIAGLAFFL